MSNTIRFKRTAEPSATPPPSSIHQKLEPSKLDLIKKFIFKDKRRAYTFMITGIALAFLIGCRWYWSALFSVSTDNAYVETEIFPVNSRMMGFVKNVKFSEGQKVKKGDLLIELDDSDVKIELEYKEAKFKKAAQDFARAQKLINSQALSRSDYEMIETAYTAAKADLEGSRLKQSFTQINAQSDGVIAKQNIHQGQFIQPGQSLLMIVGATDKNWIKANFKETQISKLKPGQKASIKLDAYPDIEWEGKIEEIYPSSGSVLSLLPPENATGNFTKIVQRIPVKILVTSGPLEELRAGVSAQVTVSLW